VKETMMKKRSKFLKELDAFIDGELDADRRAAMEQMMESCQECQYLYDLAVSVKKRVKKAVAAPAVPGYLRAKITSALDEESARVQQSWSVLGWFTRLPVQVAAFGMAAIFLAVMYTQFFGGGPVPEGQSFNKIIALASQHYEQHLLRPAKVGSKYYQEVYRKSGLPDRPAPSLAELKYERQGCCFGIQVQDRPVAHYLFKNALDEELSVVMWKGVSPRDTVGGQVVEYQGRQYFVTEIQGQPVILWKEGDVYWSVFGQKPKKELFKAASLVRSQFV